MSPKVETNPEETPIIPRALPRRDVFWEAKPANAPTQHKEAPKYAIWWISGYEDEANAAYPPTKAVPKEIRETI